MKKYCKDNVLEAAMTRLEYIFDTFPHVYFSFSGGKDSGAMIQLADQVAQKKKKTFDLLILDIEANYDATRTFMEKIKALPSINQTFHFCLPFYEDNNTSVFQPQWLMWDEQEREKWVQPMPKDAISLADLDESLMEIYQSANMNPDKFLRNFAHWYASYHQFEPVACGVGIRTQESLYRYRSITSPKYNFRKQCWIKRQVADSMVVNFYPIYDWKTEDVWGAYAHFDWPINGFYEKLYDHGVPIHQMRICQPYGMQQRKGLYQYALVEPETWERVVNRVSGANFGRLYAQTGLLAHYNTRKPSHMTWQEYAVFLLESIGLYSKKLQDHYYRKITILIDHYREKHGIEVEDIPDVTKRKDWLKNEVLWHDWKGIARALEKNDFSLSTRQYSLTKKDESELYELAIDFGAALGIEHLPKYQLKKLNAKYEYLTKKIT